MKTIIDPPEGWRYGFPRAYDKQENETEEEWFIRVGYPKVLVDQGMLKYCRYWQED